MQINVHQVIQGSFVIDFFVSRADTFTNGNYDYKCGYILHKGSIPNSLLYKFSQSNNMTTKGTFWSDALS